MSPMCSADGRGVSELSMPEQSRRIDNWNNGANYLINDTYLSHDVASSMSYDIYGFQYYTVSISHIQLIPWNSKSTHHSWSVKNIVNLNLRNKIQWILQQNSYIFIQENAFEDVICEMVAIFSRGRWVWSQNVIPMMELPWMPSDNFTGCLLSAIGSMMRI